MNKLQQCVHRHGFTGTLDGTQTHRLILEGLFGSVNRVTTTKELMESYGFEFFPTSGEELERFKRRQSNIDANILSKDEGEKRKELALTSSDAINAALAASAQSEGKSTLGD